MSDIQAAEQARSRAFIQLMNRPSLTFFTVIGMGVPHYITSNAKTAETDGEKISYNPDFLLEQTLGARQGLILHEILHIAYGHCLPSRVGERDFKKWAMAADYVINLDVLDMGLELPPNGLVDSAYRGMSTEQVYNLLPDPPPDYEPDIKLIGEGLNKQEIKELEQKAGELLIRAKTAAELSGNLPGNLPGEIQVQIDLLTKPRLPWHVLLRRFFDAMAKEEQSFKRPKRRYFPDMLLPGRFSESLNNVATILDMSGSVNDRETKHFASEIGSILRAVRPKSMDLVQFDTQIKSVNRLTCFDDLKKVTYTGRGGTKIAPVFDWINTNKPTVAIIFTDGYFAMPEAIPKIPIIWVIHDNPNFTAPRGKVIHFEIKE